MPFNAHLCTSFSFRLKCEQNLAHYTAYAPFLIRAPIEIVHTIDGRSGTVRTYAFGPIPVLAADCVCSQQHQIWLNLVKVNLFTCYTLNSTRFFCCCSFHSTLLLSFFSIWYIRIGQKSETVAAGAQQNTGATLRMIHTLSRAHTHTHTHTGKMCWVCMCVLAFYMFR